MASPLDRQLFRIRPVPHRDFPKVEDTDLEMEVTVHPNRVGSPDSSPDVGVRVENAWRERRERRTQKARSGLTVVK